MEWITVDLPSVIVGFIISTFFSSIYDFVSFLVDRALDKRK